MFTAKNFFSSNLYREFEKTFDANHRRDRAPAAASKNAAQRIA